MLASTDHLLHRLLQVIIQQNHMESIFILSFYLVGLPVICSMFEMIRKLCFWYIDKFNWEYYSIISKVENFFYVFKYFSLKFSKNLWSIE